MPFHLFFDLTRSSSLGDAGRNLQPSDVLLTCLPAAAVPNDSFLSSTCTHPSPLYFPPNSSETGCVCLAPSSAPCARPSPLDRCSSYRCSKPSHFSLLSGPGCLRCSLCADCIGSKQVISHRTSSAALPPAQLTPRSSGCKSTPTSAAPCRWATVPSSALSSALRSSLVP
jgi:hypothetical protein